MIVFPNISNLSVSQNNRFLQAGFSYGITKSLSLNGDVLDLTNGFGVTGIWTGINDIVSNIDYYQPIIINGQNFGTGRIRDISFSQGNDVRRKTYTANVEIFESGNLFNFGGTYYSNIDTSNFEYLDNISESYSFSKKTNGGYSYSHDASIRFNSGIGNLNSIASAQLLAKSLFTGSNLGFGFYSGFTNKQGKRFFVESYNLINNACSFSESFDFNSNSGNYSSIQTHSFELGQDGIISVSENNQIKGIENPNFEKALEALNAEKSLAFPRCSGVFEAHAPSGSFPLINSPVSDGTTINVFDNAVSYSIAYNNNRANSGLYFWSYNQQIAKNENIITVSENGNVKGVGANSANAFANAKVGFSIVNQGVNGRISSFYNQVGSKTIYLESQSRSYAPRAGSIAYDYSFSDEPFVVGTAGVKKIVVKQSEVAPLGRVNTYDILNYGEIIQDARYASKGGKSINVVLYGSREVSLPVYLSNATTQINSRLPIGTDVMLENAEYSYDIDNNIVEVNAAWSYNSLVPKSIFIQ